MYLFGAVAEGASRHRDQWPPRCRSRWRILPRRPAVARRDRGSARRRSAPAPSGSTRNRARSSLRRSRSGRGRGRRAGCAGSASRRPRRKKSASPAGRPWPSSSTGRTKRAP